jgi:FkbM family methyltransferase
VASPLIALISPSRLTAVIDIGANPIDGDPPYKPMLVEGLCTVTGFEPHTAAREELLRRKGPLETYLPDAIADGGTHTLHVTRASGMTSLLTPDPRRLVQFNGFTEWGTVIEKVPIATRRLDDIETLCPFDLLKIDVQGGELMVFQGGRRHLSSAVAVQTEISFVALYENQPTFADIDHELRTQGFIPHSLPAIKRWAIAPVTFDNDFRRGGNQLLEADIVYVRDFTRPDAMSDEQLRQLAMIAHHVYGSVDLAYRCISTLADRKRANSSAADDYLQAIATS